MLFGSPIARRIAFLVIVPVLFCYLAFSVDTRLLRIRINQNSWQIERRLKWDYWPDTSEEQFCRAAHDLESKHAIPNVVHFILRLPHEEKEIGINFAKYLAIRSAIVRMKASEIKIHTWRGSIPSSEYWDLLKDHVTVVDLDAYSDVQGPNGIVMTDLHPAHQSDILRLAIMQREGGIYLDTDMYVLKPFTDLLSSPRDVVMGHEGGNRYGLTNAVILARPNSEFISKWQQSYDTFDVDQWNDHSVLIPKRLQAQYPDLLCPLGPKIFFWPTWAKTHIEYMHETISSAEAEIVQNTMDKFGGALYEDQLAYHAWGHLGGISNLTLDHVRKTDTRFNLLMREVVNAKL